MPLEGRIGNNARQSFGIFGFTVGVGLLDTTNMFLRDHMRSFPFLSSGAGRVFCCAAVLLATSAAGMAYGNRVDQAFIRPRPGG